MQLVIFDLDGTLIDSKLDIAHAVNASMSYVGYPTLTLEQISSYVGDGAPVLISRALGPNASEELQARTLDYFIQYYAEHKIDYTTLYPGVRETLAELHRRDFALAVLTNKPVRISQAILDALDLAPLFRQVYGGNSFPQKKPDPIGITTLADELGVPLNQTTMVGDSDVDIQTAKNAGVRSVGVTFGFKPESLTRTPPDYLIHAMPELLPIVLNGSH